MYHIKIFSVGKTKEPWLQEALSEYEKRLKSSFRIEWILAKSSDLLKQLLSKEHSWIALTPKAKQYSSEEWAQFLYKTLETSGSRMNFIIGGAEGLSEEILSKSQSTFSLSSLTFTHQITRLILLEQIYRASEIAKGSGYHK